MNLTCRIVLHGRDGPRGYALVDEADFEVLNAQRWYRMEPYPGTFYAVRPGDRRGSSVLMHRELLGLSEGDPRFGDHWNHDGLDNRRCNLRVVDVAENGQNRRRRRAGGSSEFRNVTWDAWNGKWKAVVQLRGITHHLGYFTEELAAAHAAEAFRAEHMPFAQPDPALQEAVAQAA